MPCVIWTPQDMAMIVLHNAHLFTSTHTDFCSLSCISTFVSGRLPLPEELQLALLCGQAAAVSLQPLLFSNSPFRLHGGQMFSSSTWNNIIPLPSGSHCLFVSQETAVNFTFFSQKYVLFLWLCLRFFSSVFNNFTMIYPSMLVCIFLVVLS